MEESIPPKLPGRFGKILFRIFLALIVIFAVLLGIDLIDDGGGAENKATFSSGDHALKDVVVESPPSPEMLGSAAKSPNINADEDGDGLTFREEKKYCSDPNKADTDNDGYSDGDEVQKGYNPNGIGIFRADQCPGWEEDFQISARNARRFVDLQFMQNALKLYFARNSSYPSSGSWNAISIAVADGTSSIPNDPLNTAIYLYQYAAGPAGCAPGSAKPCLEYVLSARIEDGLSFMLANDVDGIVYGINCDDPAYCMRIEL